MLTLRIRSSQRSQVMQLSTVASINRCDTSFMPRKCSNLLLPIKTVKLAEPCRDVSTILLDLMLR